MVPRSNPRDPGSLQELRIHDVPQPEHAWPRCPTSIMSTPAQPPGPHKGYDPKPQHENIPLRRHPISHLETYDVTAQELRAIERESLDVGQDFQFGSVALAIGASFLIAMLLTTIPSPTRFACFFAVVLVMFVFAGYFFLKYARKRTATRSTIQEIRDRQLGPLGEEGREITLRELDRAPSGPENPDLDDEAKRP